MNLPPPISELRGTLCALEAPRYRRCASGSLQMLKAQALIHNSLFFFFKLIHFAPNSKTTKTCNLFTGSKMGVAKWAQHLLKP